MEKQSFECWAIVELFGHTRIAGHISEQNIAGTNMLRIDVPETKGNPAFTRFIGNAAIYAINPCDEATAREYAQRLQSKPINIFEVQDWLMKQEALRLEKKQLPEDDSHKIPSIEFDDLAGESIEFTEEEDELR